MSRSSMSIQQINRTLWLIHSLNVLPIDTGATLVTIQEKFRLS